MLTRVKTNKEIDYMREGGRMLATVLQLLRPKVLPGVSTKELADMAAKELKKLGGKPAFLGYQDFPDVLCVSVNNEVVHGIPKPRRIIQKGDIVGMDFGVSYRGLITDGAISVIAGGTGDGNVQRLVTATERAMYAGIEAAGPNAAVGDIGAAVQTVLDKERLGIVRDLVGHGVGHALHEDPNIPNFGKAGTGFKLQIGMTIAIEPMATLGREQVYIAQDGWTVMTMDGSPSAHFEHTVLITQEGPEILTSL